MAVVVVCVILALVGLIAVGRWGGLQWKTPWPTAAGEDGTPEPGTVARRYLWYVTVAVAAGLGSGVLVAGAGGRLVMRLLAATAGDAAQGRVTEAEEIVGRISLGGTIGFVVFTGFFFGLVTGALYLLVRPWLPGGRLGGLAFGGLLLVLAGTRIEPLRKDNPDFDIVGPGWLAVVMFAALVLVHGMAVAAIAGRYSRVLPVVSRRPRNLAAYSPLVLMAPVAGALVPLALVGAVTVLATRAGRLIDAVRSPQYRVAGRVLLVVVLLVALPGFVSAVVDIAGRGPG